LNIIPIQTVMAERYLYLPSAGFCIIIAIAYTQVYRWVSRRESSAKAVLTVLLVLVAGGYLYGCLQRNRDWRTRYSLWTSTVESAPGSAIAHNSRGVAFIGRGDIDAAGKEFQTAVELNFQHYRAYNNLGSIYYSQNKTGAALNQFKKSIEYAPGYYQPYFNIGRVLSDTGRINESIKYYLKAIELNPGYTMGYQQLALAYNKMGEGERAREYRQKALKMGTVYRNKTLV